MNSHDDSESKAEKSLGPVYREILCGPSRSDISFDVDQAKAALEEACVDYRGWPYIFFLPNSKVPPKYDDDSIWALSNEPFFDRPIFDYWKFDYSKALFYSKDMTAESSVRRPDILDPKVQVELMSETVNSLGLLFDKLGCSLDLSLELTIRFSPMKGVVIDTLDQYRSGVYASDPFTGNVLTYRIEDRLSRFLSMSTDLSANIVLNLCAKMGHSGRSSKDALKAFGDKYLSKGKKVRY